MNTNHITTDAPGAKDGPIARITPEADEQVDGKGRTLVEIDAALEDVFEELASYARRTENLERLLAARVSKPCEPSKATGENELATAVEGADEGWREQLVPVSFTHEDSLMWWMTPDRKAYTGHCLNPSTDWGTFDSTLRDFVVVTDNRKDDPVYLAVRSKIARPPNLAEWYKPGAKVDDWACAAHRCNMRSVAEAVPPTFRADDLAKSVRNLAAAHDLGVKAQAELRTQLAAAQTAATAAEGRADTAKKRATEAESKLAELRAQLEAALT